MSFPTMWYVQPFKAQAFEHRFEFLSLKGRCTGLSESICVEMPHFWNFRNHMSRLKFIMLKSSFEGKNPTKLSLTITLLFDGMKHILGLPNLFLGIELKMVKSMKLTFNSINFSSCRYSVLLVKDACI